MDDNYRAVIPEEALLKRRITIYTDTPSEIRLAVEAYNERMNNCKVALKEVAIYKNVISTSTSLLWIVLMALGLMHNFFQYTIMGLLLSPMGFWNAPICIGVLLAFFAAYIHFGILKEDLRIVTFASAALIIVQWFSVFIVAMNFLFYYLYHRVDGPLQEEDAYPTFIPIMIRYESCKKPHYGEMPDC